MELLDFLTSAKTSAFSMYVTSILVISLS